MMCKKMIYLISFVLVLSLAGYVQAVTVTWTDAGPDSLWSTAGNWDLNRLPTSDDQANIDLLPGPTIANEGAMAKGMRIGQGNVTAALTVDGGTLEMTGGFNCANTTDATAIINMKSGSITSTVGGTSYMPQKGSFTLNMTGGTITMAGNKWRIGHPYGVGGFDAHLDGGVLSLKEIFVGREDCPRTMDITDGMLIADGNQVSKIQGFIDEGWITAHDGTDFVSLDYDVTNPGKTTLKAAKVFMNVNPAHGSILCAGPTQLQWTLPEPNQPGGVVTCDIWFGTNIDITANPKVVEGQAVESVSVTADPNVYYWAIDVYDSSVSATEPVYLSPVLRFNTTNLPPIVDAGSDIPTFPVDGERVVQLNAVVSDECGGPGPATLEWTVISEPNELNPAEISDANVLNPTVTIKEPGSYTLQLAAGDGEFTVTDTMNIVVYADSCLHARSQPGFVRLVYDRYYDCKVDFLDLAGLAAEWLQENYSTE